MLYFYSNLGGTPVWGAPTQYIGSRSICDDMIFMSQAYLLRRFSITSFTQAGVVG